MDKKNREQRDLAIATISRVFVPPCNPFRGRQLSDQHSLESESEP
jgi:hypothetical protein